MQFTTSILALAAVASLVAAAPAPVKAAAPAKARAVVVPKAATTTTKVRRDGAWTIESFERDCSDDDSECSFSFSIDIGDGSPTYCAYDVYDDNASDAGYTGVSCGDFTISSGWSGQFGAGNGFTTLSVTDGCDIIYPAYTDAQLECDGPVSPDQSYTPEPIPSKH